LPQEGRYTRISPHTHTHTHIHHTRILHTHILTNCRAARHKRAPCRTAGSAAAAGCVAATRFMPLLPFYACLPGRADLWYALSHWFFTATTAARTAARCAAHGFAARVRCAPRGAAPALRIPRCFSRCAGWCAYAACNVCVGSQLRFLIRAVLRITVPAALRIRGLCVLAAVCLRSTGPPAVLR